MTSRTSLSPPNIQNCRIVTSKGTSSDSSVCTTSLHFLYEFLSTPNMCYLRLNEWQRWVHRELMKGFTRRDLEVYENE